jgi:hypothetical protein
MNCVGRLVERLDVDPHHAMVVHAPRQTHQRAIDGLLAPVGDESAAERRIERDLQFVDNCRSLGVSYEVDPLYGSPPDQSKGLDRLSTRACRSTWRCSSSPRHNRAG